MARDGLIRDLLFCYGIEDRGHVGPGFSLASKQLIEYVAAQTETVTEAVRPTTVV
jgi:hypothetical protein